MEKKRNLWVIPTDKPSRLMLRHRILFFFKDDDSIPKGTAKNQNIYITSDEEIKEGDAYLTKNGEICKSHNGSKVLLFKTDKKIIITTDQDLINDGVQAIDDEFLEWFIKNPSCEEVEVVYGLFNPMGRQVDPNDLGQNHSKCVWKYKIITTKEEPKPFKNMEKLTKVDWKKFKKNPIPNKKQETLEEQCACTDQCLGYLTKTCKRIEEEPKQEIVGYRLKPHIDRIMVDGILKNAMPIWNDKDKGKSVYFIRGHVAGSLVAKMKELQVLDLWFTPIYEFEEVKNDWLKQNHLDYYYKEGIMNNESKQETLEQIDQNNPVTRGSTALVYKQETLEEAKERYLDSPTPHSYRLAVEFGAKWQQERMYSEEDMRKAFEVGFSIGYERDVHAINENNRICKEWFEQFKKK